MEGTNKQDKRFITALITIIALFSLFFAQCVRADEVIQDDAIEYTDSPHVDVEGEEGFETPMAIMGEIDLEEDGYQEIMPIIAEGETNPLARANDLDAQEGGTQLFLLAGISVALLALGTFILVVFRKNALKERI
ncbi:MAG: hypothetical protein LBV67_04205 [Streptococcaceae bacterium]|nr:hypothetical protein [Streptococcaceae bacterium]